ncbi:MAG: hypothetical protein Q7T16_05810 [Candidatus Burarchaeum sp.]|nr:hypothetical protein [Candidatus Burarchaeum sp.]MDO8340142.1 hypothetical protein [Candidatus Burarchaeum sp.]
MQAVLIDTSLMLDCAKRKIDIFAGLDGLMESAWEARISEGVIRELNAKARIRGPKGAEARLALAMLAAWRGKCAEGNATREGDASRAGREGNAAREGSAGNVAREGATRVCVIVEENKGNVDGWLLARGRELGAIICTNDAGVRMRARAAGLKVISVLHNSRLGYA